MRDIFICPRGSLLANWLEAFPEAVGHTSLTSIDAANNNDCLFWLHAGQNSQQWLAANITQILRDFYHARIVVLANVPDQNEALLTLSQGATGYSHAYTPAAVLLEIKTVVTHGGIWLGPELLQRLITVSTALVGHQPQRAAEMLALLSAREQQVALQAARGLSNKEIAHMLHITERTVKAHLSASFERLGLKDRLQLALLLNDRSSQ